MVFLYFADFLGFELVRVFVGFELKWGIEYELGHVAAAKLGIGQAKMSPKLGSEEMVWQAQIEAMKARDDKGKGVTIDSSNNDDDCADDELLYDDNFD